MSAMNLSKRTSREITTVESAFQSYRIYSDGSEVIEPFPQYLFMEGKECKKTVKEVSKGMISREYDCFSDLATLS